jgi:hypothetical protein
MVDRTGVWELELEIGMVSSRFVCRRATQHPNMMCFSGVSLESVTVRDTRYGSGWIIRLEKVI